MSSIIMTISSIKFGYVDRCGSAAWLPLRGDVGGEGKKYLGTKRIDNHGCGGPRAMKSYALRA